MALPAELTLATMPEALVEAARLGDAQTLDLSGVQRADSAGVALLLELTRRARAQNRPLRLTGANPQLRGLIAFFELESALSLE